MTHNTPIIHLYSGGLDSTVMLYDMLSDGARPHCVGFYYGQRHIRELDCARMICRELDVPFTAHGISGVFSGCYLAGGSGSVVVPNRNAVMLHIAAAIGVAKGADSISFGACADDHDDFHDCRWAFVDAVNHSLKLAGLEIQVVAPYINKTKREIVEIGRKLNVPFNRTYSCYVGGLDPCGECEACKKRINAMT